MMKKLSSKAQSKLNKEGTQWPEKSIRRIKKNVTQKICKAATTNLKNKKR